MDIWSQLRNDHEELKSLGNEVLESSSGDGPASRDNQFDLFDTKLRRHLAAVEDVIFPPLEKQASTSGTIHEIEQHHKSMRRDLSSLDRPGKDKPDWTSSFEVALAQLEKLCDRHEVLAGQAKPLVAEKDGKSLGERYTRAKLKRMPGGHWNWNKIGMGAGAALGLAAAAAGVAAGVRHQRGKTNGGQSRSGEADDFELRLQTDETVRLISSAKVEGTKVVGGDGETIGRIESFMVDKYTGRVAYALLSFGGVMGVGASYFPLPWPILDYDTDADAYVLSVTKEQLKQAPKFEKDDTPNFNSADYRRRVLIYYRPA